MSTAIECERLSKAYDEVLALDNVSFSVASGEAVALLGPNGSGKTTALRCVVGLVLPDEGAISIDGADICAGPAVRSRMSFVPQEPVFPPSLRVREVLQMHASLRGAGKDRIRAAMSDSGIDSAFEDKLIGELSTGMRHRVALAVASIPPSRVMVLDEPTASLDPSAVLHFRDLACRWKAEGRAVLFSTHVMADAQVLADRVVVLVGGRSVAQPPMKELRARLSHLAAKHQASQPDEGLNCRELIQPLELVYMDYVREGCKHEAE